jgi:hypothetical protein
MRGGVPEREDKNLTIEKTTLRDQGHLLEIKRQQLNQLSGEINALVNRYNALINAANADVRTLNSDGLIGSEFEEGRYTKESGTQHIDIFQFGSRTNLVLVLAHELGHALGLGHNGNRNSIMSPLIKAESLTPSADDVKELEEKCLPH